LKREPFDFDAQPFDAQREMAPEARTLLLRVLSLSDAERGPGPSVSFTSDLVVPLSSNS
jgi:hypothetical protein